MIAIISGWTIGRFKLEHWIEDWVQELRAGEAVVIEENLTWPDRIVMDGKPCVISLARCGSMSLPEMVILRKVLKPKLIAVFIGVVGSGILFTGFLFNLII